MSLVNRPQQPDDKVAPAAPELPATSRAVEWAPAGRAECLEAREWLEVRECRAWLEVAECRAAAECPACLAEAECPAWLAVAECKAFLAGCLAAAQWLAPVECRAGRLAVLSDAVMGVGLARGVRKVGLEIWNA